MPDCWTNELQIILSPKWNVLFDRELNRIKPAYCVCLSCLQVDYIAFLQLKLPSNKKILANQLAAINSALGIQWNTVIWAELRKPLYSALGAYLYTTLQVVKNEGGVAPVTIEQQAVFWKKYYRSGGDVEAFKQCEISKLWGVLIKLNFIKYRYNVHQMYSGLQWLKFKLYSFTGVILTKHCIAIFNNE